MFVTLPEYGFPIPTALAAPQAKYWRTVELAMSTAWFALTIRRRAPDAVAETLLFVWDSDVVDAVSALDAEVLSLLCMAPDMVGRNQRWQSTRVREIWDATDSSDGARCLLFVGEDGSERAGVFFEKIEACARDRLLVRVVAVEQEQEG